MSLSTPKPQLRTGRSMNDKLQLSEPERQRNPSAVIRNDWVPATQISKMHKAEPIRRAGPLQLQWYLGIAKRLFSRSVSTRSAV